MSLEEAILRDLNLFDWQLLRYTTATFMHPFSHGYDMNYFSYTLSQILDNLMFAHWKKNNFSIESFNEFHEKILSKGATINYLEEFMSIIGGDPSMEGFLKTAIPEFLNNFLD